jgi:uncharacterized protein
MQLDVAYDFLPKQPSVHAHVVMDHFGIGFETGRHVVAAGWEVPLEPGDLVAFVGPSGSGKSSLMRAAAGQLEGTVWLDQLPLGDRILVDALPTPIEETLALLTSCGLGEAHLLLRTPQELSDGQRYRFRLALGWAHQPRWLIADEFTAALDRTLARVIAYNVRKLVTKTGHGLLVATTHKDILDDLQPDLLVRCRLDGPPEWERPVVKKKPSASPATSSSRPDRRATGRISHGGIIAAISSPSSAP